MPVLFWGPSRIFTEEKTTVVLGRQGQIFFHKPDARHCFNRIGQVAPTAQERRLSRWDASQVPNSSTLCLKNVPPLTCYNLDIHNPIAIIFSRRVTDEVRNQTMLWCPTSLIKCFSITLQKKKPRRQRTGALCMQHSPTAAALLISEPCPRKSQAECIGYKIQGVI